MTLERVLAGDAVALAALSTDYCELFEFAVGILLGWKP